MALVRVFGRQDQRRVVTRLLSNRVFLRFTRGFDQTDLRVKRAVRSDRDPADFGAEWHIHAQLESEGFLVELDGFVLIVDQHRDVSVSV